MRLSGRLRSALIIGGQGIRARKTRTFLSMISLFLGVLAVVAVQAGAETAKTLRLADLELHVGKDGTHQLYLPPSPAALDIALKTLTPGSGGVAILSGTATIGEPGVTAVNPGAQPFDNLSGDRISGSQAVPFVCDPTGQFCHPDFTQAADAPPPGQAIDLMLTALSGDVRQFRPYRPVDGAWLDFSGPPALSPRLVINKEAAKGFARYRVPAELRAPGLTADPTPRIIGVVDDGNPQPTAYVRADEMGNWQPTARDPASSTDGNSGGVEVLLSPAAGETQRLLTSRLAASGVPRDELKFQTINARKDIAQELAIIRYIFLGMAALVLLIGVAGILNVGLATVGERVEEFALRRAVGTPRSLLAGIVLAETLLTGLLTAGAAIGVGVAGVHLAAGLLGSRVPQLHDLVVPWQAGVAGVIAGLVAGLLGGFIPALRAARIPIATVMRA